MAHHGDERPTLDHIETLLDDHRRSIVEANALSAALQAQMATVEQPPQSRLVARAGLAGGGAATISGIRNPSKNGPSANGSKADTGAHGAKSNAGGGSRGGGGGCSGGGRMSQSVDRPPASSSSSSSSSSGPPTARKNNTPPSTRRVSAPTSTTSSGYGNQAATTTARRSSSQTRDNTGGSLPSSLKSALKKASPTNNRSSFKNNDSSPRGSSLGRPGGGTPRSGGGSGSSRNGTPRGGSFTQQSVAARRGSGSRLTNGKNTSGSSNGSSGNLRLASFLAPHESMEVALQRLGWQRVVVGGSRGGKQQQQQQQPRDSEIFKLMDIKGDGRIDRQELKIGLTRLRKGWVEEAELAAVMETFDHTGHAQFLDPDAFADFVRGANSGADHALENELLAKADNNNNSNNSNSNNSRQNSSSPASVSGRISAANSSNGSRSNRSSRGSSGSAGGGVGNPLLGIRNSLSAGSSRPSPPHAQGSSQQQQQQQHRRSDSLSGAKRGGGSHHRRLSRSRDESSENVYLSGGEESDQGSRGRAGGGRVGSNNSNNNELSAEEAYRNAALSMPPPPGYESLAGDAQHVAFGVKRSTWEQIKHAYRGAARFPVNDLGRVIESSGCGLRWEEGNDKNRFLQLLSLSLDPKHKGSVSFVAMEKWLRGTMALVGAVVATTSAAAPSSSTPPSTPSLSSFSSTNSFEKQSTPSTSTLRPEEHARRQIDALGGALSVSVPSIDHPALDRAVLGLARLCMHTPPGTPLREELCSVLSLKGHLPPTANVSPDVQHILDRYDDQQQQSGFVSAEGLERLLDDLDFYFPGAPGSVVLSASKASFVAKLDFFNERRQGLSSSALQVWWADLEVVVGALDLAMSDLDAALLTVDDDVVESHDMDTTGGCGGGGGGGNEASPATLAHRNNIVIGGAVAALVVAIQRANATMAPLGHRMLDEALAALHRTHATAGMATGSLLPLVHGGALELSLAGSPTTTTTMSHSSHDASLGDHEASLMSPLSPGSFNPMAGRPFEASPSATTVSSNDGDAPFRGQGGGGGDEEGLAYAGNNGGDGVAVEQLGPTNPALLGLCCLGGLHAIDHVVAHHFQGNAAIHYTDKGEGGASHGSSSGVSGGNGGDGSEVLPSFLLLLNDVGLSVTGPQQLEALVDRLGSSTGSSSGHNNSEGMLELGAVRLGLTGARLKLMRLQVALLHAVGSVAAARPGAPYPPCILIDDECAERLETALDVTLVPSPFPLVNHPLVAAARRVLSERRRFVTGGASPSSLSSEMMQMGGGGGLGGAAEAEQQQQLAGIMGGMTNEDDSANSSPLRAWHLVQSRTDAEGGVYWYNSVTGESRWDSPDRSDRERAGGEGDEGGGVGGGGVGGGGNGGSSNNSDASSVTHDSSASFLATAKGEVASFSVKVHELEGGPSGAATPELIALKARLEALKSAYDLVEAAHNEWKNPTLTWARSHSDSSTTTLESATTTEGAFVPLPQIPEPSSSLPPLPPPSNHYSPLASQQRKQPPPPDTPLQQLWEQRIESPRHQHLATTTANLERAGSFAALMDAPEAFEKKAAEQAEELRQQQKASVAASTTTTRTLAPQRSGGASAPLPSAPPATRPPPAPAAAPATTQEQPAVKVMPARGSLTALLNQNPISGRNSKASSSSSPPPSFAQQQQQLPGLPERSTAASAALPRATPTPAPPLAATAAAAAAVAPSRVITPVPSTPVPAANTAPAPQRRRSKVSPKVLPPRRGRMMDRLLGLAAGKEKKAPSTVKVDQDALNSAWNTVTDLLLDPHFFFSFEEFFMKLDNDGSAELSFEELKDGLSSAGCSFTPRELRAFRNDVDVNKDGTLSLAEFMDASRKHQATTDTDAVSAEEAWHIVSGFLLDPSKKQSVADLFNAINSDGSDDGLDLDELARGMRDLGAELSAAQLRAWQKDLDENKDGSISFEEFTQAVTERLDSDPEVVSNLLASAWDTVIDFALDSKTCGDLEKMFKNSDLTKNDVLTLDELAHAMASVGLKLGQREVRLFQKDLDSNKDGVINFEEFMEAVRRYQAGSKINHAAAEEAWDFTLEVLAVAAGSAGGEVAKITEVFKEMDQDGNNELDLDELAKGIMGLGVRLTPRQLRAFQKALDASGDGLVSLEEFLEEMANQRKLVETALESAWECVLDFAIDNEGSGQTLEGLFTQMDDDGSGCLDFEELAKGLYDLGVRMKPRGLRAFRKDVDASGDGQVDPLEFMEGVRRYQAKSDGDPNGAADAWKHALVFFEGEEMDALAATKQLFEGLDTDDNNHLDLSELIRGLKGLGLTLPSKLMRAFQKSLDKNSDGMISFFEFKVTLDERRLMHVIEAWNQVPSSSDTEEMFWHNSITEETRWDTPPGVERPP